MSSRWPFLIVALVMSLSAACGTGPTTDGSLQVVASFYPLEYVAHEIGGERVEITNLTTPGVEPHDLELTARQIRSIASADVVLYLQQLQPSVDAAITASPPAHVVDAVAAAEELHERRDGSIDLHLWLSPINMGAIGAELADHLAAVDPAHSQQYRENLHSLTARLEQLTRDFEAALADCRLQDVVVSHDAFRYLPTPFTFHPIAGLSPDAEPTPGQLATITALIHDKQLQAVFTEPHTSSSIAATLASDTHTAIAVLDPIEVVESEPPSWLAPGAQASTTAGAPIDYEILMRHNLLTLAQHQECDR